jgi:Cu-Zn family superoxide dismutase
MKNLTKIILIISLLVNIYSREARCFMVPDKDSGISGYVTLSQEDDKSPVNIDVNVYGTKHIHGFHIHEKGSIEGGCLAAGPHFNPFLKNHGGPDSDERHVGDLGNLVSKYGQVEYKFSDTGISLFGEYNIIGRTCVIHENEDDYGKGGKEDSLKTGNSGGRIACGIVQIYDISSSSILGYALVFLGMLGIGYYIWNNSKKRDHVPLQED